MTGLKAARSQKAPTDLRYSEGGVPRNMVPAWTQTVPLEDVAEEALVAAIAETQASDGAEIDPAIRPSHFNRGALSGE